MNPKFRIYSKIINRFITDLWLDNLGSCDRLTLNDLFNNKHLVFQQWTGLVDMKGEEIYEGDIVKCIFDDGYDSNVEQILEVKINMKTNLDGTYHNGLDIYETYDKIKIIGNIFDDKDLIK